MAVDRELTREEALLALNDRLGQKVQVAIRAALTPNHTSVILEGSGVLHHWHEDSALAQALAAQPHDNITGLYQVGNTLLDVTDLSAAQVLADDDERYVLAFQLADAVQLELRWLKDEGGS